MKIPELVTYHCLKCKTHRPHKLAKVKKGKESQLTWIRRQKERNTSAGNNGKWSSKPHPVYKQAKKPNVLATCEICKGHSNFYRPSCKKWEIIKMLR